MSTPVAPVIERSSVRAPEAETGVLLDADLAVAGAGPDPPSPRLVGRWWLLLVAAALSPFLIGFVARIGPVAHGEFAGDRALIALSVRGVGSQLVLLGPYSRFGWHHPGPLYFYLLAVPNFLFGGRTIGLVAGATALNLSAAIGLIVVAVRRGGRDLGLWTALLLGVYVVALGIAPFEVWNPHATVLPLALAIALAWSVACGDVWALPWLAAAGTFCVQTHVGLAPPVVGALVSCAVATAIVRRGDLCAAPPPGRTRRALTVSGGVLFVLWLPPVVEQFTSGTGNLSKLAAFFTEQGSHHSWTGAVRDTARQATLLPRDLLHQVGVSTGPVALTAAIVLTCVAFAAALVVAVRTRDAGIGTLLGIVGFELLVSASSVTRIVGALHPYLEEWISAVGMLVWLALGATVLPLVGRAVARPASRRWRTALVVALVLGVVAVAVDGTRSADVDADLYRYPQVAEVTPRVLTSLHGASHVVVQLGDVSAWPLLSGTVLQLEQHGVVVEVVHSWATDLLFDPSALVDRPARAPVLLFTRDDRATPRDTDAPVIARGSPWVVLRTKMTAGG